jgi:hypothetical protein
MSKSRSTHVKKHIQNKNMSRPLILKTEKEDQYKEYYAIVSGECGDCRFKFEEVNEGFTGVAKALKAIAKKNIFRVGDLILIQFDCMTKMYFVIQKYSPEHIHELKKGHHLDRANKEASNVVIAGDILEEASNTMDEPIDIDAI